MKQPVYVRVASYLVLIVGSILALYPFVSILILSLTPKELRGGGAGIPSRFTLDNFVTAWTKGEFGRALVSSAIVACGVVAGAVVLSILAGYALSTMRFPFKTFLSVFLMVGLVIPYEGIIIPLYYQLDSMGLLNTYWALILPQIATSVSLGIFWMRAAFDTVPRVLLDAAQVDGAHRFMVLWRVYVPNCGPAIGALVTLLFLYTWNEFLMPLVLVAQNPSVQTAPLALSFFSGSTRNFDPSVTAAAAVIVALPIIIVYVFFQRKFIEGIVSGAVKE